jgi:hypothetical protein
MERALAAALIVSLLGFAASACSAQIREQHAFGAEDKSVEHPFTLPRNILDILAGDDEVKNALVNENIAPGNLPASWFLASEVHLAGPNERDVVVIGRCPVCGANIVPFWAFRPAANGYQQIFCGGGLHLEIEGHRTNGYLDIKTGFVAQQKPRSALWRFDGKTYQLSPDKRRSAAASQ